MAANQAPGEGRDSTSTSGEPAFMPNQGGTGSSARLATGGAGTRYRPAVSASPVITHWAVIVLLLSPLPRHRDGGGGSLWERFVC